MAPWFASRDLTLAHIELLELIDRNSMTNPIIEIAKIIQNNFEEKHDELSSKASYSI